MIYNLWPRPLKWALNNFATALLSGTNLHLRKGLQNTHFSWHQNLCLSYKCTYNFLNTWPNSKLLSGTDQCEMIRNKAPKPFIIPRSRYSCKRPLTSRSGIDKGISNSELMAGECAVNLKIVKKELIGNCLSFPKVISNRKTGSEK